MSIFKHTLAPPPTGTLVLPAITVPAEFLQLTPTVSNPNPLFAEFIQASFNRRNRTSTYMDPAGSPPYIYDAQTCRLCRNVYPNLIITPPIFIPNNAAGILFMETFSLATSMPARPTLLSGSALQTSVTTIGVGELAEACVLYAIWYLSKTINAYNLLPWSTSMAPAPAPYGELFSFMCSDAMETYSGIRILRPGEIRNPYMEGQWRNVIQPDYTKLGGNGDLTGPGLLSQLHDKMDYVFGTPPHPKMVHSGTDSIEDDTVDFANAMLAFMAKQVKEYANSIFAVLTAGTDRVPPTTLAAMASGEGGSTSGLFGDGSTGIMYYNYDVMLRSNPTHYMKVGSENIENGITLTGTNKTLHLAIIGLDKVMDTKVNVDFSVGGVNHSLEFVANNANPANRILKPQSAIALTITNTPGTSVYTITYLGGPVAVYDTDTQNLVFDNTFAISSCDVKLTSADATIVVTEPDFEEACLILCVFQDKTITTIPQNFNIVLEDLFRPDEFELTTDKKKNSFPTTPEDQLEFKKFADFLIGEILFNTNFSVSTNLTAGFVGKYIDDANPSLGIESNTFYNTLDAGGRTREAGGLFADLPNPDLAGYNPNIDYVNFRYSKCDFVFNTNNVQLNIESFVDPQRSGLHERFSEKDYRVGTPNQLQLSLLTPFVPSGIYAGYNKTDNVLSYNTLLSGLRCFGILEAIVDKVNLRAQEMRTATSITPAQRDTVITFMNNVLTTATSSIPRLTSTAVNLTDADYQGMKWYYHEFTIDIEDLTKENAAEQFILPPF